MIESSFKNIQWNNITIFKELSIEDGININCWYIDLHVLPNLFLCLFSYKRIDVMCTLLNMCLPFEVRYLGTCVEDIGKRDYNDLRDTEHHANSISELAELTTSSNVTDKRTRRKLALYMALLHSCNYACAVILYKNLSNLDHQEIINLLNGTTFNNMDDQPLEELLLLYTMALNHPAFTYEQKSVFGNIFIKLQEEEARLNLSKINSSFKPAQVMHNTYFLF